MKNRSSRLLFLAGLFLYLIAINTCKKIEKTMLVVTDEATNILTNSADLPGQIIDLGEGPTQHGHYYGKTDPPTDNHTTLGAPGSITGFISQLTNLEAGSKYFFKAYITNGKDTEFGKVKSFTTIAASAPTLTTTAINSITLTGAVSGGNIATDGGTPVTARGVCWNSFAAPTTSNNKTTDNTGTGTFTSTLTGLTAGSTYFVRAYATNSVGTTYGNELTFTTTAAIPTVTTTPASAITTTTTSSGGEVTDDNGASVTERGICWGTSIIPTITGNKTSDGTGKGIFTSNLTGLTASTKYYIRAYATNSVGTAYGTELTFTTSDLVATKPTLTTIAISAITQTGATSGGNITSDGGAAVTSRGVCWSTVTAPTMTDNKTSDAEGSGVFASSITGLIANTKYYVRSYATNSVGTAYGDELNFTTNSSTGTPPTVAVASATLVTNTSATLNGAVNANGDGTTVTFEYGPTTLYGSEINATPGTAVGTTIANVTAVLSGLTPGTLYHYRVKGVNAAGTSYSTDISFITLQVPVAVTDPASSITSTTATLNGSANANNLSTTVSFEYGTSIAYGSSIAAVPSPLTGGNSIGVSAGVSGLTPGLTYHFRLKSVSSGGTTFGEDNSFTTPCTPPLVTTDPATNVLDISAQFNGIVNANNMLTEVSFEYGTSLSYGNSVSATPTPVTGNSNTIVNATIAGLTINTIYHYRVKALSCGVPVYGFDQTFTTLNETIINETLTWCYSKLYEYVQTVYLFDAVYSNNISAPSSSWTEIYSHTQTSGNAKVLKLWSDAYEIIYKTNLIITKSGTVITDQSKQILTISQAKAIRAYLFYTLSIWFGGVPLETGINPTLVPRNALAEVKAMIIQDADYAVQNLPVSWPDVPDKFRISKTFAKGLMARVYQNLEANSTLALVLLNDIIDSGLFGLSITVNNFTSTNIEMYLGFDKGSNTEFNTFFTKGSYVPIMRYTETILAASEAKYNLADNAGALAYLNQLKVRRGEATLASISSNDIFAQWNTELDKEGGMFITLKRYNKAQSVLLISDYKLLLPIPIFYLNINPNIVQNPGY